MKLTQENIQRIQNRTGAAVFSKKGERLGYISGTLSVIEDSNSKNIPEYIIIGNDFLDESSTKFFAVPAYTALLDMSGSHLTAMFEKENMVLAKRISVDECPAPFDYEPLIYELTDYSVNQNEGIGC